MILNGLRKTSPVTLVELGPTQYGRLDGRPSHDDYSQFRLPARAVHALEGVLRADGFRNVQSIIPAYHGRRGRLSPVNRKRIHESDVLGISSILRTTPQSMALAREYKQANPRGVVIVGGSAPTFDIPEWLSVADVVVRGEGERTLSELMKRMETGEDLSDLDGVAFKAGQEIVVTKPRALLSPEELSRLPHPYYDPVTCSSVRVASMETARGCPNDCHFCSVTEFYGKKYRAKSADYVIEGLRQVREMPSRVFFVDDNLYGSPGRGLKLLEAIAESPLKHVVGTVQVTVRAAEDPAFLKALRRAGIWSLCVGLESIVDQTLADYGKPYSAKQNKEAVRAFRESGFWVHGMMMPGGEGDTLESLRETSEWLNENLDSIELFPPTPYPGTRFHARMQSEGRILTRDLSLYDGQHVVIRPHSLSASQLQQAIIGIYESFYAPKRVLKRMLGGLRKPPVHRNHHLMINAYVMLKGLRTVHRDRQSREHLEFLRSVS